MRQTWIVAAAALLGAGGLLHGLGPGAGRAWAQQAPLTLVSWGGSYQKAQRELQWEPAAREQGFTFREDTVSNSYAQIKLQVQSRAVTWDIVQIGSFEMDQAGTEGLLEEIDYKAAGIDPGDFLPGMAGRWCLGTIAYSTVLAYNARKYAANPPRTWADFWDVQRFPGRRAFNGNRVISVLEIALQADGVRPAEVYPTLRTQAGIDRAFAKLEQLRPNVAVWWSSGAQQSQVLKDDEVDMTTGWNGRIAAAVADGADARVSYDGGVVQFDCYAIPKGAPNRDRAMRALAGLTAPKVQAALSNALPYGPTNRRAFEHISAEKAAELPTSPDKMDRQVIVDNEWYFRNTAAMQERFDRLRQK